MALHEWRYTVVSCLLDYSEDDNLSLEADLGGAELVGLIIPTIDNGNVTFEVSDASGGTFVALKGADGNAEAIVAATGALAVSADDLAILAPYRYVKIGTAAAQTADRTFKWIVKV